MKKIMSILFLVLLCFVFMSCNSNSKSEYLDFDSIKSTATDSYGKFKNINLENSYLGYGYDVINDAYMDKDAINMSAPIMDMEKIKDAKLRLVKENRSSVTEYESSSMEEFSQKYSSGFNVSGNVSVFFSGGIRMDFNGSNTSKSYWHFYKNVYDVRTFNLYLVNDIKEIRDMLSSDFLEDLESMESSKLFDKYGTHLIREAVMGGRMEVNSTYSSETAKDSFSVSAVVNAHIKFLSSAIDIDAYGSYEKELAKENIEQSTVIKQFGGKLIDTHDIDSLKKNYKEWTDSFEILDNSALSGIVGQNSLIGIWDLLPTDKIQRRVELEQEFVRLAGAKYDELCTRFKLNSSSNQNEFINTPIRIQMKRENCALNNGYNPAEKEARKELIDRHDCFEMGDLVLYGCSQENDKYKINSTSAFSIKFHFLQTPSALPIIVGEASNISDDSCDKVVGTSINEKVLRGAYWIRITYKNDDQTDYYKTNFMENKSAGSIVSFADNSIERIEEIKKIEVVVVYEHFTGGPGPVWLWWKDYTNWRCTYTFEFI